MNTMTQKREALKHVDSIVGKAIPRRSILPHLSGRGRFVDDISAQGLLHAAFVRSPYAHAHIERIVVNEALKAPGVVAVFTAQDFIDLCQPWVGTLTTFEGMRSEPQFALAMNKVTWQGEAVAIVIAESRALAEDGVTLVEVDYTELEPVVSAEAAKNGNVAPIHAAIPDNICFKRDVVTEGFESHFSQADIIVEQRFEFGRQTGVTLEPRAILAEFNPALNTLQVQHSHQAPHMVRDVLAKLFKLQDADVRVINPHVGGGFGLKVHIYPDEVACVAAAIRLGRPVKFVADRLESFQCDIHAREHSIQARLGIRKDGTLIGFDVIDTASIGPYSVYPRTSVVEGQQVSNNVGGPYSHKHYRAHLEVVFQNKSPTSQYRAVGHPIACAVTEVLMDLAARKLGIDPAELRAKNFIPDNAYPYTSPSGQRFESLSHEACLDKLLTAMDYKGLRREQAQLRAQGVHRGIGLAAMIELSNPSAGGYAAGGAPISAQDGATVRLEPSGMFTCAVSVGDQGQGSETIFTQIAATALGVKASDIRILSGDTQATPFGGGAAGSRGAGIGGETVFQAAWALRSQLIELASKHLGNAQIESISLNNGCVTVDGTEVMTLAQLAHVGYLNPRSLPSDFQPELVAVRHYQPRTYPVAYTNGIQASLVEVDIETGCVRLLKHWVVDDCGTVINPKLVSEQIRGGVVQGIGGVLYEECLYDDQGQLQNASLADYLVPMAEEMPDIEVLHVVTPTNTTALGAKGAGEAGTCGAPAAVLNAINDALTPVGARTIAQTPVTPEVVLRAIGRLPVGS